MATPAKRHIRFETSALSHRFLFPPGRSTVDAAPGRHAAMRFASSSALRASRAPVSAAPSSLPHAASTVSPSISVSSVGAAPSSKVAVMHCAATSSSPVSYSATIVGGTGAAAADDSSAWKDETLWRPALGPDEIFRYFGHSFFLQLLSHFYLDELPVLSIVCFGFYRLLTSPGFLRPQLLRARFLQPQLLHRGLPQQQGEEEEGTDEEEESEREQQLGVEGEGLRHRHEEEEEEEEEGARGGGQQDKVLQPQLGWDVLPEEEGQVDETYSYSLRVTDRLLHHLLLRECIRIRRREEASGHRRLLTLRQQLPSLIREDARRRGSPAAAASLPHAAAVGGRNPVTTRTTYRGKRVEEDAAEAELDEEPEEKTKELKKEDDEGAAGADAGTDAGAGAALGVSASDTQSYYEAGASRVREGLRSAFALLPQSSQLLSLGTASAAPSVTQRQQQQLPRGSPPLPEHELRQQQDELLHQQQELYQQQQELHQRQQLLKQQQLNLQRQQTAYLAGEVLQGQPSHAYMPQWGKQPQVHSRVYLPGEEQKQRYHVYLPGEEQLQLQQLLEQQQQMSNQPRPREESTMDRLHHVSTRYSTMPEQLADDEEKLLEFSVIEKILWHLGGGDAPLGLHQLVIDCSNAYTALPKLLQRALLRQAPGMLLLHVYKCEEEKLKLLLTHALQHARQLQEAALQLESGWTQQEATALLAALLTGRGNKRRSSAGGNIVRRSSSRRSSVSSSYSGSCSSDSAASAVSSHSWSSVSSVSSNEGVLRGLTGWRHRSSSSGSRLRKLHVAGDSSLLLVAAHLAQDALQREAMQQKDARARRRLLKLSALHALRNLNISHVQPVHDNLTQFVDIIKQLHAQFPRARLGLDSIVVAEKAPPPVYGRILSNASVVTTAAVPSGASAAAAAAPVPPPREEGRKRLWNWRFWQRSKGTSSLSEVSSLPPGGARRSAASAAAPPVVRAVTRRQSQKAAAATAADHTTTAARIRISRAPTAALRRGGSGTGSVRRAATVVAGKAAPGLRTATMARKATTVVSARGSAAGAATNSATPLHKLRSSPSEYLGRRTSLLTSIRRLLTNQEETTPFLGDDENVLSFMLRLARGNRMLVADNGLGFLKPTQLAACDWSVSHQTGATLHCLFSSLQEAVVGSYREELQLTSGNGENRGGETGGSSSSRCCCLLPSIGVRGSPRWLASPEGQRYTRELQLLLELTQHYVLLLPLDFAAALEIGLQQRVGVLKPHRQKVVGLELRVDDGSGAALAHPRGVVDMIVRSLFSGETSRQKEKLRLLRLRVPADAAVLRGLTPEVASLLHGTPSLQVVEIATPCVAPSRDRWFLDERGGAAGAALLLLQQTLEGFGFACSRRLASPWLCVTIMKRKIKTEDEVHGEDTFLSRASSLYKRVSRRFTD